MPYEAALGRCRGREGGARPGTPAGIGPGPTMIWSHAGCDHGGLLPLPRVTCEERREGQGRGRGRRGQGGGEGGGEGGCVWGLASVRGGGGAVSSAAERHRVADRGGGAAGAGQSRPGSLGRSW